MNKADSPRVDTSGDTPIQQLEHELADKIPLTKAARLLSRHVSSLHRARKAGRLRCYRIFGQWYTDVGSIRDMITTCIDAARVPRPMPARLARHTQTAPPKSVRAAQMNAELSVAGLLNTCAHKRPPRCQSEAAVCADGAHSCTATTRASSNQAPICFGLKRLRQTKLRCAIGSPQYLRHAPSLHVLFGLARSSRRSGRGEADVWPGQEPGKRSPVSTRESAPLNAVGSDSRAAPLGRRAGGRIMPHVAGTPGKLSDRAETSINKKPRPPRQWHRG